MMTTLACVLLLLLCLFGCWAGKESQIYIYNRHTSFHVHALLLHLFPVATASNDHHQQQQPRQGIPPITTPSLSTSSLSSSSSS